MQHDIITADRARELFAYDAATGSVTRRLTTSPRAIAGMTVGSDDLHGYKTVRIGRRSYKLHRVIWLIVHGSWPVGDIDHINGERSDNRLANLRDLSRSENLQNCRAAASHNRETGVLGVYRDHRRSAFYSRISIKNKSVHLGTFDTIQEAQRAYIAAKRTLHAGNTL